MLQRELKVIEDSANEAVKNTFTQLIHLLEERGCEVQQQVTSRQEAEAR